MACRQEYGVSTGKPAPVIDREEYQYLQSLLVLDSGVLEILSQGKPLGEVLDVLSRGIEQQSGLLCSILLLDPTGTKLCHGSAPSLPLAYSRALDGALIGPCAGSCGTAAYLGKPVFVSDIANDRLWKDYAALALEHNLRACWATPIMSQAGRVYGTFAIYYQIPRAPTKRELQIIEHATHLARIAIEHEHAKQALSDAEQRYRTLLERLPAITYVAELGRTGKWHYVSPQIETMLGFSPSQWLADPSIWFQHVHPDDRSPVVEASSRLKDAGGSYSVEYRMLSREGKLLWFRDEGVLLSDPGAETPIMEGLMYDITERKRVEQELESREEQYRRLVENIPEVVWRADEQGNALFVGERMETVFGYSSDEILTRGAELWFSQMHAEDRDRVREAYDALFRENKPFNVEYRIRHKDGEWMWWHDRAVIVAEQGGRKYADGLLSDISERRELEAQLLQAQKMEAVGQLAGGIAHDFNNLLCVILGNIELLKEDVLTAPTASRAKSIEEAAQRASSLTQQLLAFSRKQMLQVKVIDLNEVVSGVHRMLSRLIGEDVDLTTRLASLPMQIKADPVQLEQVIMNLAVNARDAMPAGGKLTIETSRVELDEVFARQHRGSPAGPAVVLTVSDTGEGMDAATRARIFEPFFTTKERGRGTGLGLATVYGIVKQSGGYISVYSEPGQGTTFRLYFAAQPGTIPCVEEKFTGEIESGNETILVAEDEPALRDLIRVVLEGYGYRILQVANPHEAVYVAGQFEGSIHLLLTDVIMPQGGGRQLARRLLQVRPGMAVVFMTGYTDDVVTFNGLMESGAPLLRKPFTRRDLAAMVRSTLDQQLGRAEKSRAAGLHTNDGHPRQG